MAVGVGEVVRDRWRAIVTPFATFAVGATLAQLLLPTDLLPDNGNSSAFLDNRMAEYPGILSDELGLGDHTWVGVAVLVVALCGAVIGVRRRPTLDTPLLLLAVLGALAISTHLRRVDRYWFQVTPWVAYFATVALVAAFGWLFARRGRSVRLATAVALLPLGALVVAHGVVLAGDISDARQYNDDGRVQSGPSNPVVAPIFDAVDELTPPDRDHRVLPRPHDDADDRPAGVPDQEARQHRRTCRFLRRTAQLDLLAARAHADRSSTGRLRGGLVGSAVDPVAPPRQVTAVDTLPRRDTTSR